ncbi:MAG: hypothetical protein EPN97_01230 [Alphaproteobacteria bacterium]|nr:MAG: hypothetical protein EPN97_01230 [Alphaproteobacteria bacterium]
MNAPSDIADAKPRALVSPTADFWLVGGASLALFALFVIVTDVASIQLGDRPAYWAFYLSFLVNDPHFIYSYFLFYRGFRQRLTAPETERWSRLRLVAAGIAVPALMTAFLLYALVNPDPKYVDWAFSAMIFSVGWHYVKQGYGVLITLSLYEGVYYNAVEKRILWANAYVIWIFAWVAGVVVQRALILDQSHYGVHGITLSSLPEWFGKPALWGAALLLPAAAVLLKHWLKDDKGISGNAAMGYFCALVWVMMPFINPAFLIIIPMFHSLQYLPFVYKMKKTEFDAGRQAPAGDPAQQLRRAVWRTVAFTLGGLALGAVVFELLPKYLDREAAAAGSSLHPYFFFLMFLSFINIHHYFMDSAFWRRDNAEVQRNLFRA